jgi:hypothetical protein
MIRGHILVAVSILTILAGALPFSAVAAPAARVSVGPPALAHCAQVQRDQERGVPTWLADCGTVDPRGNPEAVARSVLAGLAGEIGLRPDGQDLALLQVTTTQAGNRVRFEQTYKGVPVYLGQLLVKYTPTGRVQLINNHTVPNIDLDVRPTIGADDATSAAMAVVAGSQHLRHPLQRTLVIYSEGMAPALAWHVVLSTQEPVGDWHVMVSATTGDILGVWDELSYQTTGTGAVYDPNPVQQSNWTDLRDNADATNAILDSARVTVTLNNLDTETNQLRGAHVDLTGAGVTGCSLPYVPGTASEASRTYTYTRDDDRFEEVNVYAAIDGVQEWFQSLGFTDVNNRSIPVDAHCIGADQSFYSGLDTGLHFGDGGVDDAEDADIVLHEYGHAVQHNQVPGFSPVNNTEQRAIGEGFGDFLAGMYYVDQGDATYQSTRRYCIGDWDATSYNPVTAGNAGSGCLRWINGRNEDTGADIGTYGGTPSQAHNDGRFWSAAMTCIYEGMGADATARDDIMRLILEHHFDLTPDSSNQAFENSIDALLLEDQALFDGANQTLIASCANDRLYADSTPPVITPSVVGTLGSNGWYTSSVTVSWAVTESESLLETTSGCAETTLTSDTTGVTLTCSATSGGGTATSSLTIKIDQTAPTVTVPANLTAEATDASGAVVTFSASATDAVGGALTPSCNPASGSTFPRGATTVTCTATDSAGNTGSASFSVTVVDARDAEAPVVTVPGTIRDLATSPAGAVVSYSATATDVIDGALPVTCDPPSGSTFPIGTTTVTCTATDAVGNVGTATFQVMVGGPVISQLSPNRLPLSSTPQTLTIRGSSFAAGATVTIGLKTYPATVVSSTGIRISVVPKDVFVYGWLVMPTAKVTVTNPGGVTSNSLTLYLAR